MSEGPLSVYRAGVAAGEITPDLAQEHAVARLQEFHLALAGYRPALAGSGWLGRFGLRRGRSWLGGGRGHPPYQGLYLHGPVGRGKSMLMDLFFRTALVAGKRRVHFHEFMRDIHREIHRWRQAMTRRDADPIPKLARTIAAEAWLLCLDELQVTDIGDAMIVGRLFQALLDEGVVMVITSNRAPAELYRDGLQRDRFLPFIALIEQRFEVLELQSERDYRLGRKQGLQVYHWPNGEAAETALDLAFARLTEGAGATPQQFEVNGHPVRVPLAAMGVARFSFDQLCGAALGPSDYLALASRYHVLILADVPLLSPANADKARRFVTLVDALYERRVTLICSAAAAPERLYPEGEGAFEFERTVSRLMEMQSDDWLRRDPPPSDGGAEPETIPS